MAESGLQAATFSALSSPPRPTRMVQLTPGGAALYTPSPSALARGQVPPVAASPGGAALYTPSPSALARGQVPPVAASSVAAPQIRIEDIRNQTGNQLSSKCPLTGLPDSSLSLQGQLVDDAVQNLLTLPEVVEEVCVQQQDQADQLLMQKQLLQQAQEHLEKGKAAVIVKKQELASLRRRIYLAEEANQHKHATCNQLSHETYQLVGEAEHLKHEVDSQQRQRQLQLDNFAVYFTKMKDHARLVEEWQSQRELYQVLAGQQEQLRHLRAEKADFEADLEASNKLLTGQSLQQVRADIADIVTAQEAANSSILDEKKKVKHWNEKQRKLTQEMEIMNKKNSARVTRLQHQLKERQVHNRLWNEECGRLEKQISQLRLELQASQAQPAS